MFPTLAPSTVEAAPAPDAPSAEAERMNALHRLDRARRIHPELHAAETKARADFAVAIIAMDEAETAPGQYCLDERIAADAALTAYGRAVISLLLSEDPRG